MLERGPENTVFDASVDAGGSELGKPDRLGSDVRGAGYETGWDGSPSVGSQIMRTRGLAYGRRTRPSTATDGNRSSFCFAMARSTMPSSSGEMSGRRERGGGNSPDPIANISDMKVSARSANGRSPHNPS
jgi:hypothetical protein